MSAERARALARATYAVGERVEMGALAERLGVNRVTLYRWVGSREDLLAELVWERMERGLRRADERSAGGTTRIAELLLALMGGSGPGSPGRAFVDREPKVAMRVMTGGVVHERLIDRLAGVVAEEAEAGRIAPRFPVRQVAEVIVRSGEAVFWFDVLSGRGVQRDNLAVLLEALCPPR